MLENESSSALTYDIRKKDPHFLLSLINKYVNITLIKNITICGFINSIDPIDFSIIVLEVKGEVFQTTILPGHAILNVEEVILGKEIKLPTKTIVPLIPSISYEERKKSIMSWFKQNLLSVTESGDNIVFGNVLILPPYNYTDICTDNPIVAMQVINIMKKMPENLEIRDSK